MNIVWTWDVKKMSPVALAIVYLVSSCVQCIQFFFSKTLFDFKKSISGLIELKFSGKTPNEVLYAQFIFGVSIFSLRA